jgi:hypothetical protein
MANIDNDLDLKLMQLEGDFFESVGEIAETFTRFQSLFPQISITPENSEILRKYFSGMQSLSNATHNLTDAFKALCTAHSVDI